MLMNKIAELDEKISVQRSELKKTIKERINVVYELIEKAGIKKGMVFYSGTNKKIVMDFKVFNDEVRIILAPVKKDGITPSKYQLREPRWDEVVHGWLAQRDDPEKYAKDLEEKWKKQMAEAKKKLNDDMF